MGQAKQRGTFEERQAAAVARNQEIEKNLPEITKRNPAAGRLAQRCGIQRLAVALVAAGAVTVVPKTVEIPEDK